LLSGTFSTILVSLGAGRIGRSAQLDWMEIATVYFGQGIISAQPTWYAVLGGLLVHQSADLGWAVVYFGLLGRWTRGLSPTTILLLGIPWAVLTSAIEYWGTLPWLQPIVPMQVPYWTALTVHLTSSLAYPVYPWVRSFLVSESVPYARFGGNWLLMLGVLVLVLGVCYVIGEAGNEPAWCFLQEEARQSDQDFLRSMTAHHEVGVVMAQLAAERAIESDLRMLGRLMVANQRAEIGVMQNWWRSWYDMPMPGNTTQERARMPGMPTQEELGELARLHAEPFQRLFIRLMVRHHKGAIMMARETWGSRGDSRIWFIADSIIHSQTRQIDWMERYCDCQAKG
jgi:uncharacterized protein (DUF305 family)